jgi:hypothetical protein
VQTKKELTLLDVNVDACAVHIGERFSVSFQRTLRIPDDGRTYPLPPGLGVFPLLRVQDHADRLPPEWVRRGGAVIPMYQREALWLAFEAARWKPNAVKIAVGGVDAVSGGPRGPRLHSDPQDYVVCPDQPWLDGINVGQGVIRQFVAMPLGLGYTVEAALTGAERTGGIQVTVFEPKPGRFPDEPPAAPSLGPGPPVGPMAAPPSAPMGLGAGGEMKQKIYPDPHGIDTWDQDNCGRVFVWIVNSEQYREITGLAPPPTPVDAAAYTQHGLPWFELYDEDRADLAAPESLARAKTIAQRDAERGAGGSDEAGLDVPAEQVEKLHGERSRPSDRDAGPREPNGHSPEGE